MPLALTQLPVVQLALVLGSWNGRSRDLEARPAVTITALTRGNCNTLLNIAGRNRPPEQTPEGVLDGIFVVILSLFLSWGPVILVEVMFTKNRLPVGDPSRPGVAMV